ncbi:putative alcohol dehydrogenase -like domain-containing protein [Rosellinia necatrix]|uniref:Putative alcohol dehydrogenase-like domain-containing protein n=1 Tax=Rosellinia necatrix TaxID=77044 RepID=A0A1W2TEV6_ROSNE|nr:putative alcohol dehydrogenase -like domain-containing protein [Rosellinia necatrix]
MKLPTTMNAVVFDGPYKVSLQQKPVPKIQGDGDIIVKVLAAGLCGSELHTFRGHEPAGTGFIMGHEFTGNVVAVGKAVQTVKIGDKIVAPFTVSCLKCFYCNNEYSSRCVENLLFGSERLDGAQADYIRVPFADGTVVKAPSGIDDKTLILMADIFPTGFFGARNAFNGLGMQDPTEATAVVIGCGPVGLCALVSALEYRPKHMFAIDSVNSRLEVARRLGAEPLNFKTDPEGMIKRIREVTEGRGADIVIEVVGLKPALRTAYEVVRPFGFISSIGVHNSDMPFTATDGYDKNVRIQMGRCPVRSVFHDALEVLIRKQHVFGFMFEHTMPLSKAVSGYDMFDKMQVQKVIFEP